MSEGGGKRLGQILECSVREVSVVFEVEVQVLEVGGGLVGQLLGLQRP